MNLLKLLKSLPAKYAARRMASRAEAIFKSEERKRFMRFCHTVAASSKSELARHKEDLGRLLELLPPDLSLTLMESIEKSHPGLVEQISQDRVAVNCRLDHVRKTEFVATLFLPDRVRQCADAARRIMEG